MLEIEEVKRFSFDDILRHDYFEDYFIKINLRKEDKTKYIINKIRLNAIIK